MDINLIVILVILLFAIAGFISSEVLLVTVWRSQDERKKPKLNRQFSHPRFHGTCYDECMTEFHWDPGHVSLCLSTCKS